MIAIGDSAFYWCSSLTALSLPEGLMTIGKGAFSDCTSLTDLRLPDSLQTIRGNPFAGTPVNLQLNPGHPVFALVDNILFEKASGTLISYPYGNEQSDYAVPEGTLAIGDRAFSFCSSLTTLSLPEGLQSIGKEAFAWCNHLTVRIPQSVTSIGSDAFHAIIDLTLAIDKDSFAASYAEENGLHYIYTDAFDI